MAGAVLQGISVIFRPSDRLVGGRESVIDMPESISRLESSALSPDHPIEDTSLIYTDDLEETDQQRERTAGLATSPVPLPSTQSVRALHHYNLYAPARSRTRAFECVRARSTAGRWFQSAARFRIRAAAAGRLRAPERRRAPRAAGRPAAAPPDRVFLSLSCIALFVIVLHCFHCLSLSCIFYCIWTPQYFDLLFVRCVHLDSTMRVLDD